MVRDGRVHFHRLPGIEELLGIISYNQLRRKMSFHAGLVGKSTVMSQNC